MKNRVVRPLFQILGLALLGGCGGSTGSKVPNPAPLSDGNLNLVFVVSEDLAYQAPGDVNPTTANLTNQGLQRALRMASFLKKQVLGSKNVTDIYTIEPMTHPQTANQYPDLVSLGTMQQFAVLNQITLSVGGQNPVTGNSYPLNVSYALPPTTLPNGVAPPLVQCAVCQGIDFNNQGGDNEALVDSIVKANAPGFHVFSAPWETTNTLLTNLNMSGGYNLPMPSSYAGPNTIYAISITPSGRASLATYNSNVTPPATYPSLPSPPLVPSPCTQQTYFEIEAIGGRDGAQVPQHINTNETIYMIRHVEAHPNSTWEDGNFIGAGQWRALDLPNALRGKISPTVVYSIDPAQATPSDNSSPSGRSSWSYVRTDLTVEPYAIANNLPYKLAASFEMLAQNAPQLATQASGFFFNGGDFNNQTVLLGWEHDHIPPTVNALLATYYPNGGGKVVPNWPDADFDTLWTVALDGSGNLKVSNGLCEGINTALLPATPPQF